MKAKVLVTFKDLKEKKLRHVGEVFECSEERFKEILNVNRLVEAVEEDADGAGDAYKEEDREMSDADEKTAGAAAGDATGASGDETEAAQASETEKKTRKSAKKAAKKTED